MCIKVLYAKKFLQSNTNGETGGDCFLSSLTSISGTKIWKIGMDKMYFKRPKYVWSFFFSYHGCPF